MMLWQWMLAAWAVVLAAGGVIHWRLRRVTLRRWDQQRLKSMPVAPTLH